MAVNTGLGGVELLNVGRFSRERQQEPKRYLNGRETVIPDIELKGIKERQAAMEQRENLEEKLNYFSQGQNLERASAESTEGDVAIGKLGKNHPGDTRMAQVFKALGVQEDLMSAIIASAQIRKSDNR